MSTTVTRSEFRSGQSLYLDIARWEPVVILGRGTRRRGLVVSPEFYDRAVQVMEDIEDIRAATARQEVGGSPMRTSRSKSDWTDLPAHVSRALFDYL